MGNEGPFHSETPIEQEREATDIGHSYITCVFSDAGNTSTIMQVRQHSLDISR